MPDERSPDLFDFAAANVLAKQAPLAHRRRPTAFDEVVGQRHLVGDGAPLRTLIEANQLKSSLLYGPPGTGKTNVALLIASSADRYFHQLSAVSSGVREVRDAIDLARRNLGLHGRETVLFIDEIHRFSRSQQDALLPGVENGTIVLVGATTENPFFALNAPLLSRLTLFRFERLTDDELREVARRSLVSDGLKIDDDALDCCVTLADGDARAVLTALEVAQSLASTHPSDGNDGGTRIDRATVEAARSTRALRFSRDEHFDVVSALIKSIRGSDPDAGVYWLTRLLEAGEDPRFIVRRLIILASEDIGNANPMSLLVAVAAAEALDRVGLPEASLNLVQAVTYLALAPKSNAVAVAMSEAMTDVQSRSGGEVPMNLRDGHYKGASQLGHGVGYRYPHDDPRGWVEATYLPQELVGRQYYRPAERGEERELKERLEYFRSRSGYGSHNVEQSQADHERHDEDSKGGTVE